MADARCVPLRALAHPPRVSLSCRTSRPCPQSSSSRRTRNMSSRSGRRVRRSPPAVTPGRLAFGAIPGEEGVRAPSSDSKRHHARRHPARSRDVYHGGAHARQRDHDGEVRPLAGRRVGSAANCHLLALHCFTTERCRVPPQPSVSPRPHRTPSSRLGPDVAVTRLCDGQGNAGGSPRRS